eukprot:1240418-Pyramimonas_sp.AAC.1
MPASNEPVRVSAVYLSGLASCQCPTRGAWETPRSGRCNLFATGGTAQLRAPGPAQLDPPRNAQWKQRV